MIRRVATLRLCHYLAGTGQGISSSDVNHEVFSLYKEYKREGLPEPVDWLLDRANEIG